MEAVWLYVYDLSEGIVSAVSSKINGIPEIRGIWHSSLVIYNKEIEFGRGGITVFDVGASGFTVVKKYYLGKTNVSFEDLKDYLVFLSSTKFRAENYNLITFNCNVFANFLANELVQRPIPEYLLQLPKDCILNGFGAFFNYITKMDISSLLSTFVNKENIRYHRYIRK